jgi:hypothetical protein
MYLITLFIRDVGSFSIILTLSLKLKLDRSISESFIDIKTINFVISLIKASPIKFRKSVELLIDLVTLLYKSFSNLFSVSIVGREHVTEQELLENVCFSKLICGFKNEVSLSNNDTVILELLTSKV